MTGLAAHPLGFRGFFKLNGILDACALSWHRISSLVPAAQSTLLGSTDDLVLVIDNRGRILDINQAALDALETNATQVIGQTSDQVLGKWGGFLEKYGDVQSAEGEMAVTDKGSQRSYDFTIFPVTGHRGTLLGRLVVLQDIAARKRARARMLQQQRAWAVVEERERLEREIAELLHGTVQSRLLVACHQLEQCDHLVDNERPKAMAALAKVKDLLKEIMEQRIRPASHRLQSPTISLGLGPAVRSLVDEFSEYLPIEVHIDPELTRQDGPGDRFSQRLRLAAYRVVEEGLINIHRHAKAGKVRISLEIEGKDYLNVSVRDDGCGFDVGTAGHGLGLSSIAGRVEQVGGTWQIASSPGHGTTLSARFPLGSDETRPDIPTP